MASDLTLTSVTVPAKPYEFTMEPTTTALVIIDMQRDFLEPGGFGAMLGNDVSHLAKVVEPLQAVLAAARASDMMIVHTREGHRRTRDSRAAGRAGHRAVEIALAGGHRDRPGDLRPEPGHVLLAGRPTG